MRTITIIICAVMTLACALGSIAWLYHAILGEREFYVSAVFGLSLTFFFAGQFIQTKHEKL